MIKSNLAILLAERGLKMSDVINETKLAKNTVRSLYYNEAQGIQFNTLETLCDYLSVDIDDLLVKINFNISIKDFIKLNEELYKVIIFIDTTKEYFTDEIVINYDSRTPDRIYPPLEEGETEPYYSIKISRKVFNTLLTLPEKRQYPYLERDIIIPSFEMIGTNINEHTYIVYVQDPDLNTYSEWHSHVKF